MVSSSCKNPCFCTCGKIWLWSPECGCYRQFRHLFFCLLAIYIVDDQTETIAKINQRCCNSRTGFRGKYQSCRIFSVTHRQRIHFDGNRTVCDGWAYFQHMCFQNTFFSRNQIVCIVFHKGSSLCVFFACSHDLHQTYHGCGLPVTFTTESITFFHQSLDGQTRQLLQCAKITEMSNNRLIILLFQESLKTDLDLCLYGYMFFEFFRIASL